MREYRSDMRLSLAERRALVNLANAGLIGHEFSIKCFDCFKPWGKAVGGMRITAINSAANHARLRLSHTVYIYDYGLCVGKRVHEVPDETAEWGANG